MSSGLVGGAGANPPTAVSRIGLGSNRASLAGASRTTALALGWHLARRASPAPLVRGLVAPLFVGQRVVVDRAPFRSQAHEVPVGEPAHSQLLVFQEVDQAFIKLGAGQLVLAEIVQQLQDRFGIHGSV